MLSSIRIGLNSSSAAIERALDIPGYIPFIGSISGSARIKLGLGQALISLIAELILLIGKLYSSLNNYKIDPETPAQWHQMGIDNGTNALGNLGRGAIESLPFINMLLFKYDMIKAEDLSIPMLQLPEISAPLLNMPLLPSLLKDQRAGIILSA